jgi:small GTP-binding protein
MSYTSSTCCYSQGLDLSGNILVNPNTISGKKHDYKVVIMGDSGIGKTCLLQKYINGTYPTTTSSTIGIGFYNKKILHEGEEIYCSFWDTAGQEKYNAIVPTYTREADVCLLAFDLTVKDPITSIKKWLNVLSDAVEMDSVYVVLVGTKCDLSTAGLERVKSLYPYNCHATSALNDIGVQDPFNDFLSRILVDTNKSRTK